MRLLFSNAAATRSLSANCLFTANSDECVPGVISTVTLKRGGSERNSLTLIDRPINVAMLQCGIVGVKLTNTSLCSLSTRIRLCCTTWSSSNVSGCSGSLIKRIRSVNCLKLNWKWNSSLRSHFVNQGTSINWTYQIFHVHQMDHQLCHPNRLHRFFYHLIFCTHSDLDFQAPWLKKLFQKVKMWKLILFSRTTHKVI